MTVYFIRFYIIYFDHNIIITNDYKIIIIYTNSQQGIYHYFTNT